MSDKRDCYVVLEVERNVDAESIKKAYRRLAVKHHPDKNQGDSSAEEKFKELGEAYEILSDQDKRAAYDRHGHAAVAGGGRPQSHSHQDIFAQMFGGGFGSFFGGHAGPRQQKGEDIRCDISLNLEEVIHSTAKEITIPRFVGCEDCNSSGTQSTNGLQTCTTCSGNGVVIQQSGMFVHQTTCPECRGAGVIITDPCRVCSGEGRIQRNTQIQVNIPAGVNADTRMCMQGNGNCGRRNSPSGDLYIHTNIVSHSVFRREDTELFCDVPLNIKTATLGGTLTVPTFEGGTVIKIPAGTQSGSVFKLSGRGAPTINSSARGSLNITIQVEIPVELDSYQQELLNVFTNSLAPVNEPLHEGFITVAERLLNKI